MTRRLAVILFAVVAGAVALLFGWWLLRPTPESVEPTVAPSTTTTAPRPIGDAMEVVLYFPNDDGALVAETRELPLVPPGPARAEAALRALFAGPRGANLASPFPEDVQLDRVELGGRGDMYVGLTGPATPPAGGSLMETLRIWSVVNTALAASPEAKGVILAWNGMQRESLSGHIDTGRPLSARTDLVVPASP